MKFLFLSASLFLLPLAAQADEIGFSYQSQDGTVYTSTTAPSWCRRYYLNDVGNTYPSQGTMPYACANPQFTTSKGRAPRKAPAKWTEGNGRKSGDDGVFSFFKKAPWDRDDADETDYKNDGYKKDKLREARVPPAPVRSRSRSRVREKEKEIEIEITPVLESDDEKEGKGLIPPAPIPPAPQYGDGSGDDFGGKFGKKDLVPPVSVPPAPSRRKLHRDDEDHVVIRGSDDPSDQGKKDRVPPVRVPPRSHADLPPRPPADIPNIDDGGDGRYDGKGGKDQQRLVQVPPAPDYGDDTGLYDGKGKKEQKRTVRVPPAPRQNDSFMNDWGISLDALRARLQPVRVVQPSGKVTVSGVRKPRRLPAEEEASCVENKPVDVLPLAPWMKDVQRITAAREPAAAKGDLDLLTAIKNRTPEQEKCAAEAPKSPSRVVLAFDAFGAFDYVNYYKKKNVQLPEKEAEAFKNGDAISNAARKEDRQVPGVHWKYYSKESLEKEQLSPAARCAFELATKPYKTKDGKTVYNTISLVGHSFGGDAAFRVASTLRKLGIRVDLMLTTDPRQSLDAPKRTTFLRPDSVDRWVNFYQRNDPLLKGFPVDGAINVNISSSGAWHGRAPHAEAVRARAAEEVMALPLCKADLSTPVYIQPKAACAD